MDEGKFHEAVLGALDQIVTRLEAIESAIDVHGANLGANLGAIESATSWIQTDVRELNDGLLVPGEGDSDS